MEPVSSGVAVNVGGVGHDAVGSAAGDAVLKERGGQVVGDPGGGAVEWPLDVADGTEASAAALVAPCQTEARPQTKHLVPVVFHRVDHLEAVGHGGIGGLFTCVKPSQYDLLRHWDEKDL